jgi:cyclase
MRSNSIIRIIPSLLLSKKRLVKGINFEKYLDAGDPVRTCVAHDSQDCDEICIIDLDAYKDNIEPDTKILEFITKETATPIIFGGNIKSIHSVEKIIRSGADKVLINSNIFNKKLISEIIMNFGGQCIVAGVDLFLINGDYKVYSRGNILDVSIKEYIKRIIELGVGELKITYVNLEGTRSGIEIFTSKKIINYTTLPTIIEGGVKDLEDLENAINNGIKSIAIGSMLVFSDNNIFKIKQFLENRGFNVRLRN